MEDAGDGEPVSLRQGEELSDKHEEADDGENAGEHGGGLHCLEVVCRGSQREQQTSEGSNKEEACVTS